MFDPCLLTTGFGALWCTDWEYPVLVRVDERDRTPQVSASWPAAAGRKASRLAWMPSGCCPARATSCWRSTRQAAT